MKSGLDAKPLFLQVDMLNPFFSIFPTKGYCIANKNAEPLIGKIEEHLKLCNNEATDFQCEILATQMPSMLQRIHDAYKVIHIIIYTWLFTIVKGPFFVKKSQV